MAGGAAYSLNYRLAVYEGIKDFNSTLISFLQGVADHVSGG